MTNDYIELLEKLVHRVRLRAHKGKRQDIADKLGQGGTGLIEFRRSALAAIPEPNYPLGAAPVNPGWLDLALAELELFNRNGFGAVGSVAEAIWKTQGIMNVWHGAGAGGRHHYFRGEVNYSWTLLPSAARNGLKPDHNLLKTSQAELDVLEDFKADVENDAALHKEIFPDRSVPIAEDPGWWAHMQHYRGGTRMIDITSSPQCGLWFACSGWDGEIDETVDGKFYVIPSVGRPESDEPDIINGVNVGGTDQRAKTATKYFNVHGHETAIRFRDAPDRNDRVLAQDGLFLWQPNFDAVLGLHQPFEFRVPGGSKKRILTELHSLGYTADRLVRGERGRTAHVRVCDALGVDP